METRKKRPIMATKHTLRASSKSGEKIGEVSSLFD